MTLIDPSSAGQCFTAILGSKDLQKLPVEKRRECLQFTSMRSKGGDEEAISHALNEALDEVLNLIDQGLITDLTLKAQLSLGTEHDSTKSTPATEPTAHEAGVDEPSMGGELPTGATPADASEADSPRANDAEAGADTSGGACESYDFAEGLVSNGEHDESTIPDPPPEIRATNVLAVEEREQTPMDCSTMLDGTPGRAPRTDKSGEAESPGSRSQGPHPTAYGSTNTGGIVLCHNKQPEAAPAGGETSTCRRFSSTDEAPQFVIDDQLRHLLPPLSGEEQAGLEREILRDGCTDSLICYMRDGTHVLIDGHHRYEIIQRHKLPFTMTVIEILTIEQAQAWILEHARGRRTLTQVASRFVRGQSYNLQRVQGARTDLHETSGQNDQKSTAQQLAELHRVGEKTIRRDGKFADIVESMTAKHGVVFRAKALSAKGLTVADFAALPQLDEPAAKAFVEQVIDDKYRPGAISKAVKEREGNALRPNRPKPGDSVTFKLAERDGDHFAVVDLGTLRLRIDLSARSGRVSVLGRDEEGSATTA